MWVRLHITTEQLFPTYTDWMSEGGGALVDVVTWHWYPLEGPACPLGGFPVQATPERVITPHTLSMDAQYRQTVLQYAAKYGNNTRVWLGEMAAASCGGADNVTDAWSGAFYYLNMLGSLGEDGHDAVMRQSLWSSEYGACACVAAGVASAVVFRDSAVRGVDWCVQDSLSTMARTSPTLTTGAPSCGRG